VNPAPAPGRGATETALDMLGRLSILAEAADQLGIGVAGISAVGQTASLTLAYGVGHDGAARIFDALGIDDWSRDEYPLPGRPTFCATGERPGADGIAVALWFCDDPTDEAAAETGGE
jgi:hypothetical protein